MAVEDPGDPGVQGICGCARIGRQTLDELDRDGNVPIDFLDFFDKFLGYARQLESDLPEVELGSICLLRDVLYSSTPSATSTPTTMIWNSAARGANANLNRPARGEVVICPIAVWDRTLTFAPRPGC